MSSGTTKSTGFYDFLAWLEANKNLVITGAVVLVFAGFGVAFVRWQNQQTELEASDSLLKLRAPLGAIDQTKSPKPDDFLSVANNFPGTRAAERAELLGAGAMFAEGNYSGAASRFESFYTEHPNHPMAATAAFGIATALEAQGKRVEALRAYENVSTQYPTATFLDNVKLSIARIYEADSQNERAFKIYEELSTSTSGSRSVEALSRKERLSTKFPELAKASSPNQPTTNTAPSIPTITAPITVPGTEDNVDE